MKKKQINILKYIIIIICALSFNISYSYELSKLTITNTTNYFHALIDLPSHITDNEKIISIGKGFLADYLKLGIKLNPYINSIKLDIIKNNNKSYIKLISKKTIPQPFDIIIKISTNKNNYYGIYKNLNHKQSYCNQLNKACKYYNNIQIDYYKDMAKKIKNYHFSRIISTKKIEKIESDQLKKTQNANFVNLINKQPQKLAIVTKPTNPLPDQAPPKTNTPVTDSNKHFNILYPTSVIKKNNDDLLMPVLAYAQ